MGLEIKSNSAKVSSIGVRSMLVNQKVNALSSRFCDTGEGMYNRGITLDLLLQQWIYREGLESQEPKRKEGSLKELAT